MNLNCESLHKTWNQVTGQQLNPRATERLFFEFWSMDFTDQDLQCVLKYMIAYNRKHPNTPMKIQAHKVLGDLETFASVLSEAMALERNKPVKTTPRESVLMSFRRTTPERTGNFLSASEVLSRLKSEALQ